MNAGEMKEERVESIIKIIADNSIISKKILIFLGYLRNY